MPQRFGRAAEFTFSWNRLSGLPRDVVDCLAGHGFAEWGVCGNSSGYSPANRPLKHRRKCAPRLRVGSAKCLSEHAQGIGTHASTYIHEHETEMHTIIDAMETLTPSRLAWRRALDDPSLRDLPYRIETNAYGQLVMSPVKYSHSVRAGRIADLLRKQITEPGLCPLELAVDTPGGVKVPDVAWMSAARASQQAPDAEALPVAPEICVEVLSESNTPAEIDEKRALYFACGAEEVWTCAVDGRMRFFDGTGEVASSGRVLSFPHQID